MKNTNEAARIVTGTTRSISLSNLYKEIGWLSLSDRRQYQKIILTFKIKNNMVPDYLNALFPRPNTENRPYNLRNVNDFVAIPRRTALFEKSFVPSAIELWNNIPVALKETQSLGFFKRTILQTLFPTSIVPQHFLHGSRKLSIIHARLRNNCSDLKYDLFMNHVSDNNLCLNCHSPETAEHYFFQCKLYPNERLRLFENTCPFHPLSCNTLLIGRSDLLIEHNCIIVEAVHGYIKSTKRFQV